MALRLYGRIIKGKKILKEAVVENNEAIPYNDALEHCLIAVCKELDVQVPMWLKNNTSEFVSYRRTFFREEHFVEAIKFDKLEIRVE